MFTPETTCLCCFQELHEPKGVCPYCGCNNATISNEAHQLEAGSILVGTYLIGKVLGQGGFGITYVGWDLNLEIKVAIKEYYPEGCVTRDTHTHVTVLTYAGTKDVFFQKGKERFVGEARSLAKFSGDSGVVGVRAFFYENGTAYIVMDFVDGETLKAYAARVGGRMPASQVLSLFQPLIRSLARVHESGLLHRDISPDNIMLKPDGTLALLDFGAARQISVAGEHSNTINVKHGFAPEEQYRTRGEQGPWTDVYALCATIYRLTTGVTPTEALDRMANDEPLAPPNAYGADFTPEQEAALMHGLALRANARTRDLRQLTEELYAVSAPAAPVSMPENRTFDQPKRVPQQEYSVTVPVVEAPSQAAPMPVSVEEQIPQEEPKSAHAEVQSVSGPVEEKQRNATSDKKEDKKLFIFGILAAVIMVILFVFASRNSSAAGMASATEEPQMTLAPEPVVEEGAALPDASLAPVQIAEDDPSTPIDWQDPIIEAGIRKALGKNSSKAITTDDLAYITYLAIAGDEVFINNQSFWAYISEYDHTYSIDAGSTMLPITDIRVSLADLKYFRNLQDLNLTAVAVDDLQPLQLCTSLNSLTLNATGDVDFNIFKGCASLNRVSVSCSTSVVLTGAGIDSNITELAFDGCANLSYDDLADFQSLVSLQLFDENLSDLVFLSKLQRLTFLNLSGWKVENITPIATLRNLQSLMLQNCQVKDITALETLTTLTSIMFNNVPVSDISALAQMKNLSSFDCSSTNITDFSPLQGLPIQFINVEKKNEDTLKQMFPSAQVYGY